MEQSCDRGQTVTPVTPQQDIIGPMCNEKTWDDLISAMLNKQDFKPDALSVSYMLAGEGTALGVSNSDPYATDPAKSDDWVKEGPHLMIIVPDRAMLKGCLAILKTLCMSCGVTRLMRTSW